MLGGVGRLPGDGHPYPISRRVQDSIDRLGILPCIENSVNVDKIAVQHVVYRKRETLRKGTLEATVGFMDASIDPQRLDVCGKAVIEKRAKTWSL
jgi:hypothetical protein